MNVDHYLDNKPNKHYIGTQQPLSLYTYSDVFPPTVYQQIKDAIISHLTTNNKLTYKTHRSSFTHNDRRLHIVSHKQNGRQQEVIYDLTFERDWWYQTSDTIHAWTWATLQNSIHPLFFHVLTTFNNESPFLADPECWVPYRWHINYMEYTEYLQVHGDMNPQYFNTPTSQDARARTTTFYLHDHVEGHGGEFYTMGGYVYKPKQNEAISINGNACYHGVNSNMDPDKEPRLAFSIRWAHKDDLYLPGHPDKAMYTIDFPEK